MKKHDDKSLSLVACTVGFPMLDGLARGLFPALAKLTPRPLRRLLPLLSWITFLGSANWSCMSGIPQTKGLHFLLHKEPHCTQQAQILSPVKEKRRGSQRPYLLFFFFFFSNGKLNPGGICRQREKVMLQCTNGRTEECWEIIELPGG